MSVVGFGNIQMVDTGTCPLPWTVSVATIFPRDMRDSELLIEQNPVSILSFILA